MNEKAASKEFGTLYLDVNRIKADLTRIQESLERKADEQSLIPSATEDEINALQRTKADKTELENLEMEVKRLNKVVADFEEDLSQGDSYDENDDSDSQVEDVISLDEPSVENDDEVDDEDFYDEEDPSKKLADKAKELANKNLYQGTGFERMKKIGEAEDKPDKIKEEMNKAKQEGTSYRKNTDLTADMKEELKESANPEKFTNPSSKQID
jgi:hypothetical protein